MNLFNQIKASTSVVLNRVLRQGRLFIALLAIVITGCDDINVAPNESIQPTSLSLNANLSNLSVSEGALSPSFNASINTYTVLVDNSITNIQTTATAEDSNASITINGATVLSGTASSPINLNVGDTTIVVVVTAEDGVVTNTYTITVAREPSNNADLVSLTISQGSLGPAFNTATRVYNVSVTNDVENVTITPTKEHEFATITVNGNSVTSGQTSSNIALAVGDTNITTIVTAENGVTTNTYTFTVTRSAPLSSDADLTNLTLSVGSLTPVFDAATQTYTASVSSATTSITVTPVLSFAGASVTINAVSVASGVASSAINLSVGSNTVSAIVLAEDGVTTKTYTITVTRAVGLNFGQTGYLKSSFTGANQRFGFSVAVEGNTLAMGSLNEAGGIVYIYQVNAGVWSLQQILQPDVTDTSDQFGSSLSFSSGTLVVGAQGEDSNTINVDGNASDDSAINSGAAYVFTEVAGTWTQQAYLKSSSTAALDNFGASVSVSGDTIVVGARGSVGNSGRGYVFTRTAGVWSAQAELIASNASSNAELGWSAAISGETIALGGRGFNNDAGVVIVFTRSGVTWTEQAIITASNADFNDEFGYSVFLDGDDLAIGAPEEESDATGINGDDSNNNRGDLGAVYLYKRTGSNWNREFYIKPLAAIGGAGFGSDVVLKGNTLLIGAVKENGADSGINGDPLLGVGISSAGAAYYFTKTDGVWEQEAYLKSSNPEFGDRFGINVDMDGEIIAVGAWEEDSNATGLDGNQGDNSASNAGAVYAFDIDTTN